MRVEETILDQDSEEYLMLLEVALSEMLAQSMECSTALRMVEIIIAYALISIHTSLLRRRLMRPTETTTNGARCLLRVLPNQASSHQTELSKSIAWTSGRLTLSPFQSQLQTHKQESDHMLTCLRCNHSD